MHLTDAPNSRYSAGGNDVPLEIGRSRADCSSFRHGSHGLLRHEV